MTQKSVQGLIAWLRSWFDEYYEDKSNKVSSWSSTTNNTRYPSEKLVKDSLDLKSDFGHGHTINDITTPMYSSSQIDTMLQDIKGDTATDVMDKVGMWYVLRNETVYDKTYEINNSYWQGVMEFGLSAILQDYIIDGEEGVYRCGEGTHLTTDLFYFYDGNNLELLTPSKIKITCSNYNPDIDSTITVRVTYTDMFDNPIPFENLTLNVDAGGVGDSFDLITNQNGVATYTYTCSSWGICRFSIQTFAAYINVGNPYPVGSIYMSVTNTNPAVLFGGTWVQLENRFLLGAGSNYTNGSTGGSANAVVVSHNHAAQANSFVQSNVDLSVNSNGRAVTSQGGSNWHYVYVSNEEYKSNQSVSNSSTTANRGESGTGKNMPPYLVVYMWKRTA